MHIYLYVFNQQAKQIVMSTKSDEKSQDFGRNAELKNLNIEHFRSVAV